MSNRQLRFIDLFAGLGGFHVALNRLGAKCVFAAEWKESLRTLYKTNFDIDPSGDITQVDPASVPDHDLLAAGFPCQPFSKAGDQLGFECTNQGGLFFNVADILRHKKPQYFILENVPNLLRHDEGKTWEKIKQILGKEGLGYDIRATKLSPHNFGIPQIRERVYIVGSKGSLDAFVWPETKKTETCIDHILDTNPPDAKQFSTRVSDCLDAWDAFLKACPKSVVLPSFPLWSMEWGATYPFEEITPYALRKRHGLNGFVGFKGSHGYKLGYLRDMEARWAKLPSHARTAQSKFPEWKKDFIRQNREFYLQNKKWIDPWMPRILEFPSSLQKLEWNVHGGVQDIWRYVLQFRASGVRVKRRTTAPSLIAMTPTQVPIIAWERRYMTPRECARLQSLDGLKALPISAPQAFHALGNAVNSKVVEHVIQALLEGHAKKPSDKSINARRNAAVSAELIS